MLFVACDQIVQNVSDPFLRGSDVCCGDPLSFQYGVGAHQFLGLWQIVGHETPDALFLLRIGLGRLQDLARKLRQTHHLGGYFGILDVPGSLPHLFIDTHILAGIGFPVVPDLLLGPALLPDLPLLFCGCFGDHEAVQSIVQISGLSEIALLSHIFQIFPHPLFREPRGLRYLCHRFAVVHPHDGDVFAQPFRFSLCSPAEEHGCSAAQQIEQRFAQIAEDIVIHILNQTRQSDEQEHTAKDEKNKSSHILRHLFFLLLFLLLRRRSDRRCVRLLRHAALVRAEIRGALPVLIETVGVPLGRPSQFHDQPYESHGPPYDKSQNDTHPFQGVFRVFIIPVIPVVVVVHMTTSVSTENRFFSHIIQQFRSEKQSF